MHTLKRAISFLTVHRILLFLFSGITFFAAFILWNVQPWMPSGTWVQVRVWQSGEHNIEVWQKKNDLLRFEPFETHLFIRFRDRNWRCYTLDIDSLYKPSVSHRETGLGIEFHLSGQLVGRFDPKSELYRRHADGAAYEPGNVDGRPPGKR